MSEKAEAKSGSGVDREGSTANSRARPGRGLSGKATQLILNYGLASVSSSGRYINETAQALKDYVLSLELAVDRSRSTPKTNPDDA